MKVQEVAERLKVTPLAVYGMLKAGKFPGSKKIQVEGQKRPIWDVVFPDENGKAEISSTVSANLNLSESLVVALLKSDDFDQFSLGEIKTLARSLEQKAH